MTRLSRSRIGWIVSLGLCGWLALQVYYRGLHIPPYESDVLTKIEQGMLAAKNENAELRAILQDHTQQLASLRAQIQATPEKSRSDKSRDRLQKAAPPDEGSADESRPDISTTQDTQLPKHDVLTGVANCGVKSQPAVAKAADEISRQATEDDTRLCAKYSWKPLGEQAQPRRVFLGALVADEERLVFELLAAETAGVVSAFAFVEGNMTLDSKSNPRKLRFCQGSSKDGKWLEELFSTEKAVVAIGAYTDMSEAHKGEIEYIVREAVTDIWVKQGMTHNDVGILVDADETFTHEIMQAMKRCDVPGWQSRRSNRCRRPKLVSNTVIMEGYFNCVWKTESGFHPDAVIGHCLEALNPQVDSSNVTRSWDWTIGVDRDEQDGLWNMADYKFRDGAMPVIDQIVTGGEWPTAFHFHNFWGADSGGVKALQFKYKAYGHSLGDTENMALGEIGEVFDDVEFMRKCFKGIPDEQRSQKHWTEKGFWLTNEYKESDLRYEFPVPQLFYTKPEVFHSKHFVNTIAT